MGCCEKGTSFTTESLCPYCFAKIPATRELCDDDVYLVRIQKIENRA